MPTDRDWLPFPPDREFDLFAASEDELHQPTAGAYLLLRNDGGEFDYPMAKFRTFYVGESGAGQTRLQQHQYHAGRARAELQADGRFSRYWWARYALAGAFGAEVWWFAVRPGQASKQLESMLADKFYWAAGAIPIANGRWPGTPYDEVTE